MNADRVLFDKIATTMGRHVADGYCETVVPKFVVIRSSTPWTPERRVREPTLYLVIQGEKRIGWGNRHQVLGPSDYLLSNPNVPVQSEIPKASVASPYLGIALKLDPAVVATVLAQSDVGAVARRGAADAITSGKVAPELLDAFMRLASLLDSPRDIPVIAPLLEREIIYRVLSGSAGLALRQLTVSDSRFSRIAGAIEWIRLHYKERFRSRDLADAAGLSLVSFHRRFRDAVSLSPLQFQKQLRLQEARRLLRADSGDAATIAMLVGYESPSQFSREYKRRYGCPPRRDANKFLTQDRQSGREGGER